MKDIAGLSLRELEAEFKSPGQESYRARQVFSWIHRSGASEFSMMSDLPAGLRGILKEKFAISTLKAIQKKLSSDGTEKFLFQLKDKSVIEAVSIPATGRITGCVSSQAGCKYKCGFCASGSSGFKRNLSCAEIMEQVLYLRFRSAARNLTHVVFMGTGEPLDNYDSVLSAVRLMNSKNGLNIGARRITISTCGIIPGIQRLAREGLQVELSVSLHAADDLTRTRLMPVNRKYPVKDLMRACRDYIKKTGRQITFEYIMIKGINSGLQNAKDLSIILKGIGPCKVNLIAANPAGNKGMAPPAPAQIRAFKTLLSRTGVSATLRRPRGTDIEGACGQLRLKYANE